MRPHEERIPVGGIDVHTWVGGQGDPLLVLHGAGGNRGWRRWMERVAERYTVWAPTHPGFGASGDAEWMEGVDDLARFYLWFIDAARLGRPHLLGQSLGGWTAAEMAAMSPGAIDRLVLAAAVGLKPERGEILDVFYHSPQRAARSQRPRPPEHPRVGRALRPRADAGRAGDRRAQSRDDGAPGLEAVHAQSAAGALPAARDQPDARSCGAARTRSCPSPAASSIAALMPNATLTVLERCGHLIAIEQPDAFAALVLDFLGGEVRP